MAAGGGGAGAQDTTASGSGGGSGGGAAGDAGGSAASGGASAGGGGAAADCRAIAFPAPPNEACDGEMRTVESRPYCIKAPKSPPAGKMPVIFLLHAYGEDQDEESQYFAMNEEVDARGFVLVKPDGVENKTGKRFWNAFPVCCDSPSDPNPPDDVGYLDAVLADVEAAYPIDDKRVFFTGHSDGAFMSHAYACAHADKVAAFVSLAGGAEADACHPTEPVNMVEIHGTDDMIIPYNGGGHTLNGSTFPSVADTMAVWVAAGGCQATPTTEAAKIDLAFNATKDACDLAPDGNETNVEKYPCPTVDVEHWKIENGVHGPGLSTPSFAEHVLAFLLSHPKK
jgi:polyhydroxybutyrate depolymerase